MKALLHTAPYQLAYTDVAEPRPGPDDVLVRVQACGICGSDVHGYTGRTGRRLPPIVMGHEAAGVVEAVGAAVEGITVGERVCFDSTVYCNRCEACRQGRYNRCERREVLGVSVPAFKRQGAFAERVAVPWWIVARMPEHLSFTQAALLEPVSIGLHAVRRGEVGPGHTVLVVGAGTIGLLIVQAARLAGAERILVSDLKAYRLDLARQLGADVVVDPSQADLAAVIREETSGKGADVSFEAVGFAQTLQQAVDGTGTGGTVVLVGNLQPTVSLNVQEIVARELTLRGTYASSGEYREAVALVAEGRIDVLPLVSETLPLAAGQQAFDRLHQGEEALVKILLVPPTG